MECSFCTEPLLWDLGVLNCGHAFHDLCLLKYKRNSCNNHSKHGLRGERGGGNGDNNIFLTCPICRAPFQNWIFAYLKFLVTPSPPLHIENINNVNDGNDSSTDSNDLYLEKSLLKIREMEYKNEKLEYQIKLLKDCLLRQEQQITEFVQSKNKNNSKRNKNFIGRLFCIK